MSELTKALDERFDDPDEIKEVVKDGCGAGVSGFIYYYETTSFFNTHKEDIENKLIELMGPNYLNKIFKEEAPKKEEEKINKLVWTVVENYCKGKVKQ